MLLETRHVLTDYRHLEQSVINGPKQVTILHKTHLLVHVRQYGQHLGNIT